MTKIEVDFPGDFSSSTPYPIPIGRLILGEHVARIFFKPNGTVGLAVSKAAIEDGSVILTPELDTSQIGFL